MTLITFLYFLGGLALLIFIHELGHFLVAKWVGIRVEQFSLGFGPKLIWFRRGETEYKVSLLPLGGYVKMSGEEPEDDKIKPVHDPKSFASQALYKRIMVVLAGPVMNLVLAMVLMPLVFMVGHREPSFLYQSTQVIGVKKDSAADKAGILKGDQIIEMEGHTVKNWREVLQTVMMSPGQKVSLKLKRGEELKDVNATLDMDKDGKVGVLGVEPPFFVGNEALVDKVSPNSPAEKAGLLPKDKIVSMNGIAINTWDEMSEAVAASQGNAIQVEVLRGEERKMLELNATYDEGFKKWILGITKMIPEGSMIHVKYGFVEAIQKGMEEYYKLLELTLQVLKKLFSFELSIKALGGPVQIAQATAHAAETGFGDFLYFISFLSIQLGIMNLLPIPVLDGGHLLFMLFEVVRGKALPAKTRMIAMQVGMVMLFSVMILVTMNDLSRISGVQKLVQFVTGKF